MKYRTIRKEIAYSPNDIDDINVVAKRANMRSGEWIREVSLQAARLLKNHEIQLRQRIVFLEQQIRKIENESRQFRQQVNKNKKTVAA